jgi:hypothetical protein
LSKERNRKEIIEERIWENQERRNNGKNTHGYIQTIHYSFPCEFYKLYLKTGPKTLSSDLQENDILRGEAGVPKGEVRVPYCTESGQIVVSVNCDKSHMYILKSRLITTKIT